jgi:hypothetical protein
MPGMLSVVFVFFRAEGPCFPEDIFDLVDFDEEVELFFEPRIQFFFFFRHGFSPFSCFPLIPGGFFRIEKYISPVNRYSFQSNVAQTCIPAAIGRADAIK